MSAARVYALLIAVLTCLGAVATVGVAAAASPNAATASAAPASPTATTAPVSDATSTSAVSSVPGYCSSVRGVENDPQYASFVQHVKSIGQQAVAGGLPATDLHLPYAGPIEGQTVGGVAMTGSQLTDACDRSQPTNAQTEPTGVAYNGQIDTSGVHDRTLESNSVAGILTVTSPMSNFYPGSGTPTLWGAQENVVLPNVTILGQQCPSEPCAQNGSGNYVFWVQNVISYDSNNDTLYFVDDTWNFTSYYSEMFGSSLVKWSPNGGNYSGTWVAFSPYYYLPPPFTVTAYVNTSVDAAGDQVLWYNYSISTPTHFVGNGNYDYLVFDSQPAHGKKLKLSPPDFEASATAVQEVPEEYEFDAFIGADDGSNQLVLSGNATLQVQYCDLEPYCTPSHFAFANVPSAVNYGGETGEQTIGVAVNYGGTTAYLSAGPLITHGLWNYTGETGVSAGMTRVANAIQVSGDPEGPLSTQPYVFVFLENRAFRDQGYQWAPDVPAWYLMPGTYRYQILLADYDIASGTLTVGATSTTLSATLSYDPSMGVYTPLWALDNGQLAGISSSGSGSIGDQYVPFNNPTTGGHGIPADNLSAYFLSWDDWSYPSFPGVLFDGTSAYVDLTAPPSFCAGTYNGSYAYLGLEFFDTSHVTLANDANVQGWPAWGELAFYIIVPASQNPAPQAEVFLWNSTDDLVMSNRFVATAPQPDAVAPDALVMYGGGDNVVWGNTFTDAPGTTPSASGQYAGIGLGESGDLIYNNNFSVDNPVVYLPYNWPNVVDCLPQSLGGCSNSGEHNGWYYNNRANEVGNSWNVARQPASDVVEVVNGFSLSGNILGPAIPTQGGNYYWNYGTSPNGYGVAPYVSRFYYSDWSNLYPLGCGSIQVPNAPCGTPPPLFGAYENGIATGGDYAPYGPTVDFTETGLPSGTEWQVTIGGAHYASTSSSLLVAVPFGQYSYSVSSSGWQSDPGHGTVFASGVPTVAIHFSTGPGGGHRSAPDSGTASLWILAKTDV